MKPRYLPNLVEGFVFLGLCEEFDLYFCEKAQPATLVGRYGHGHINKAVNVTLLALTKPDKAPAWLLEVSSRAKLRDLIGECDQ